MLSGCSANFEPDLTTLTPQQTQIGQISGTMHGGQSPVSGAQIYLFATGTTGYGSASKSLITSGYTGCNSSTGASLNGTAYSALNGACYVTTDASGGFTLTGDYTCTVGSQVYLVGVGGNPGEGGTVDNTYIVQMVGLGQCPSDKTFAGHLSYIVMNEITTTVFAYSMSGFGSNAFAIGVDSTGTTAIANAMATATNIVNIAYGQVPTTTIASGSKGTLPVDKIYALADILGTCVNTNGSLGSSTSKTKAGVTTYTYTLSGCGSLFNYTTGQPTESGGTFASTSDLSQAAFSIAQNPTTNVSNLFGLIPAAPVFQTAQTTPNDWTLPIIYSNSVSVFGQTGGSNTKGPFSVAIDSSGNAWIGDRINGVVEITPSGKVSTYDTYYVGGNKTTFTETKGVAIAPNGNIWVADYGANQVYIMDTSGTVQKTLSTGLNGPADVAFNAAGNAYIVNEGNATVTVYDSTGSTVLDNETAFGGVGNGITTPDVIAIDPSGNAWIPSTGGQTVGELTPTYGTGFINNGGMGEAYWLGFDGSGVMYVGDIGNSYVDMETYNSGTGKWANSHKSGGGVTNPDLGAIDAGGLVWMPDMIVPPGTGFSTTSSVISAYQSTTAKFLGTGIQTGGQGGAVAAAVDLSGNVWVANEDGSVSELLGAGTPTSSPLSPSTLGKMP